MDPIWRCRQENNQYVVVTDLMFAFKLKSWISYNSKYVCIQRNQFKTRTPQGDLLPWTIMSKTRKEENLISFFPCVTIVIVHRNNVPNQITRSVVNVDLWRVDGRASSLFPPPDSSFPPRPLGSNQHVVFTVLCSPSLSFTAVQSPSVADREQRQLFTDSN